MVAEASKPRARNCRNRVSKGPGAVGEGEVGRWGYGIKGQFLKQPGSSTSSPWKQPGMTKVPQVASRGAQPFQSRGFPQS